MSIDLNVVVGSVLSTSLSSTLGTTDGEVIHIKGRSAASDGGEGWAYWDAADSSSTDDGGVCWGSGSGRWKRIRAGNEYYATWYGSTASAWNTFNTTVLKPLADLDSIAPYQYNPVTVVFPPGDYTVNARVDLDLPRGSVVQADGAVFIASSDLADFMFDLNPDAWAAIPIPLTDDYTKRQIKWFGGTFVGNTAATASGIRAVYMRVVRFEAVRLGYGDVNSNLRLQYGFYYGGKDTYHFVDCYTFGCDYHYYHPDEDVLHSSAVTGNDTLDVELRGCHSSCTTSDTSTFYMGTRCIGTHIRGGSMNGSPTGPHIHLRDSSTASHRCIEIHGLHMEGAVDNQPSIHFDDAGGQGFDAIDIGGGFEHSGNTGCGAILLKQARGVVVGASEFLHGTAGEARYGISVDTDCRNVRVTEGCRFVGYNTDITGHTYANNGGEFQVQKTSHGLYTGQRVWVYGSSHASAFGGPNGMWASITVDGPDSFTLTGSTYATGWTGGTIRLMNAITVDADATRQYVTVEPAQMMLTSPIALANFNGDSFSTVALPGTTIEMDREFTQFLSLNAFTRYIWPIGYVLALRARDSGSLASASSVYFRVRLPGLAAGLDVYLDKMTNDGLVAGHGMLRGDSSGDLQYACTASGSGTLDVWIEVSGVLQ